jgi:hypothetical protein
MFQTDNQIIALLRHKKLCLKFKQISLFLSTVLIPNPLSIPAIGEHTVPVMCLKNVFLKVLN